MFLFSQPQEVLHEIWDIIGPVASEEMFDIVILGESWLKDQTMTLTSSTHKSSGEVGWCDGTG